MLSNCPRIFSSVLLDKLSVDAAESKRGRKHFNIHRSFDDPAQILFNVINSQSYIQPHRHFSPFRNEFFLVVRGAVYVILFSPDGVVEDVVYASSDAKNSDNSFCLEVPGGRWHTVISDNCPAVILEIKDGPFDPMGAKDLAPWAPAEGDLEAESYLERLLHLCRDWIKNN